MPQYHVVTSSPDFYKGVTGKVFAIHDASGKVRGIPYYDVQSTADKVCEALNSGSQLRAELRYKHNHKPYEAEIITTYAPASEVLYYHVQDKLDPTVLMSRDSQQHREQALNQAGYSEPVVSWVPVGEKP